MPAANYANLSHAFHHTAPSLVSSVGSVGLGSAGEASGAGSDFGVTPSISLRPSGQTIWRSNTILTGTPPLDSSAASVVGSTFPRSDANAEPFSIASLAKYSSPPTRSKDPRIMSFRALV